jgi:hypothetical protein
MKKDEDEKQIIDATMNTIFIYNLQKIKNCSNVGFGMQKSTYDMLGVSTESTIVFVRSSRVFA